MMTRVDEMLMSGAFSPLAGWLEHRRGIGRWAASLECLNGSTGFYVAAVAVEIAGKGLEDGIFVILLRGLGWLLVLDWVRKIAFRQAGSTIGTQSARLGEMPFRLALAAMLPVSFCYATALANLLYSLSLGFLVLHLYLKACDAPPPQPRGKLAFGTSR